MNEILILEEVLQRALLHESGPLSFVGRPEGIQSNGTDYDFFFHLLEGTPYANLPNGKFVSIPLVLHPDVDAAKVLMAEIHSQNPKLNTFALRSDKKFLHQTEKGTRINEGLFLSFYDLTKKDVGIELKKRPEYSVLNKQKIKDLLLDQTSEEFEQMIAEECRKIDSAYR